MNFEAFRILIASRRPDAHLRRIERRVHARTAARRPVADGVRPVLLEQPHRRDDVALRLRHLLAVGVEHPAGDRGVAPWQRAVLELGSQHRREEPRPDDVVGLRPERDRERPCANSSSSRLPSRDDLRRQRRCRPRVHDVGIADEAAGLAALRLGDSPLARRSTDRWADVQSAGTSRCGVVDRRRRPESGYHTGKGTPKKRCRLTHQSPLRPFTQFSKRARMYGGCQPAPARAR